MTTPATPCANCEGPEHPHPVMTGEDTGCMAFMRPAAPSEGKRLPPEIVAAIDRYREMCQAVGCRTLAASDDYYLNQQIAAREKLEAALAPYLAAAECAREYRDAWDAYLDLPNGCDGRLMQAARDELARSRVALDAAIAASRAVPPAPGTGNG